MEYTKRNIVDRIAVGDDCFRMEKLSDGRYRLIPAPDSVVEAGTNIDRNLLQPMEDMLALLASVTATTALFAVTIPVAGWTEEAPFSVTIPVEGMLASDTPLTDIVQSGNESSDALIRDAWTKITRITTADDSITVYAAEEVPDVEVPIQMRVVR